MAAALSRDGASRRQMTDEIVEMAIQYVRRQLIENRVQLLAEQAFRQEALINQGLRPLADAHRGILSQGAEHFFQVLGSDEPAEDAKVLTAIILRMEYQGLLDGVDNLDIDEMRAVLKRYLYLVMGL